VPAFYVEWSIEVDAESPEEAARITLETQRDPDSLATCFVVSPAEGGPEIMIEVEP
jgi:hypothetical protein